MNMLAWSQPLKSNGKRPENTDESLLTQGSRLRLPLTFLHNAIDENH